MTFFFYVSQLVNENHLAHFLWNYLYVLDRNYRGKENGEPISYLFLSEIQTSKTLYLKIL